MQPHQRILRPCYLESTSTPTKLGSGTTRSHLIPFKSPAIRIASLTSIGVCNLSRLDSSLTSGQVICHTLLCKLPPSLLVGFTTSRVPFALLLHTRRGKPFLVYTPPYPSQYLNPPKVPLASFLGNTAFGSEGQPIQARGRAPFKAPELSALLNPATQDNPAYSKVSIAFHLNTRADTHFQPNRVCLKGSNCHWCYFFLLDFLPRVAPRPEIALSGPLSQFQIISPVYSEALAHQTIHHDY